MAFARWIGIFAAALLAASPSLAVQFVSGPSFTLDPNGLTPLAGLVEAVTDVPTRVTLSVTGPSSTQVIELPWFRTHHHVPVLGLRASTAYTVDVVFTDAGSNALPVSPPFQTTTGPLPVDFPTITVNVSDPPNMEPGYTLLDRFNSFGATNLYSMILDETGAVVWYSTKPRAAINRMQSGNLLFLDVANLIEADLLGREERNVLLSETSVHHDLFPTSYGTYISLTSATESVSGYPTSETDPGAPTQTANIRDDPVTEFVPDGNILAHYPLTQILDPTRIAYDSLNPVFFGLDWVHSNAVLRDPSDDTLVVSMRHQDAVVKFTRSGQIKWILGPHANWTAAYQPFLLTPVGLPFEWNYHQHAPEITPQGTWLIYDNGNRRASPFDGNPIVPDDQNRSRVVEYAIDEQTMEVSQLWEYAGPPSQEVFTPFIGDVDWLPQTGNVHITFGATTHIGGVPVNQLGMGNIVAKIVEVTHTTPATPVFEVTLDAGPGERLTVYRSERIPDLYPSKLTACQDGEDNDGDGTVDFDGGASANGGVAFAPPDPNCTRREDDFGEMAACGIGPGLALLLPPVLWGYRRRLRS